MGTRRDISIKIAGAAGQGMQTTATLLGRAATRLGFWVYAHSDAESRIRGGLNFSQLRIAVDERHGLVRRTDILVAHTQRALEKLGPEVGEGGGVLAQENWAHPQKAPFHLAELAKQAGSPRTAGAVAIGAIWALLGLPLKTIETLLREVWIKSEKLTEMNLNAAGLGYEQGLAWDGGAHALAEPTQAERLWITGGDAISLGALAGGVRFMAAYPMSPATAIMVNLAEWSRETGVLVEQAEDEIAAINMTAGAAYAGARSLTATSGGGFDLMTEGVSLLGMIEAPAVIVIAQRPGPATGLATRTEQGDLPLAVHGGHGHFARVVLAPCDIGDGFVVTARAFDIAEKYQAPVFVLTDQQLQDGAMTTPPFSTAGLPETRHFLTAEQLGKLDEYVRYAWTDDGISPQAAPGVSEHLVVASSDEHNEAGHINVPIEVAERMAEKRLRKIATVAREVQLPLIESDIADGRPLVIGWGSSFAAIDEAREVLRERGAEIGQAHFRQLWPLQAEAIAKLLDRAGPVIVVENNPNGALADLLQQVTGRLLPRRINKHDGRAFTVEELVERLGEEIER
jgi:2-oxoglutarate/2-oxoacid ferredoxin oxidoreductase subunit alpha